MPRRAGSVHQPLRIFSPGRYRRNRFRTVGANTVRYPARCGWRGRPTPRRWPDVSSHPPTEFAEPPATRSPRRHLHIGVVGGDTPGGSGTRCGSPTTERGTVGALIWSIQCQPSAGYPTRRSSTQRLRVAGNAASLLSAVGQAIFASAPRWTTRTRSRPPTTRRTTRRPVRRWDCRRQYRRPSPYSPQSRRCCLA
jgi:hypothetical protein